MSYQCGPCEGANPVTVLLTNLATGGTDCSCDADLPLMLVGHLAIWLQVEPQGLYDAIRKHADREAKKEAAAAAKAEPPAVEPHEFMQLDDEIDGICQDCEHGPDHAVHAVTAPAGAEVTS